MRRLRGLLVLGLLVGGALLVRAVVNFWLTWWLLMLVALATAPPH